MGLSSRQGAYFWAAAVLDLGLCLLWQHCWCSKNAAPRSVSAPETPTKPRHLEIYRLKQLVFVALYKYSICSVMLGHGICEYVWEMSGGLSLHLCFGAEQKILQCVCFAALSNVAISTLTLPLSLFWNRVSMSNLVAAAIELTVESLLYFIIGAPLLSGFPHAFTRTHSCLAPWSAVSLMTLVVTCAYAMQHAPSRFKKPCGRRHIPPIIQTQSDPTDGKAAKTSGLLPSNTLEQVIPPHPPPISPLFFALLRIGISTRHSIAAALLFGLTVVPLKMVLLPRLPIEHRSVHECLPAQLASSSGHQRSCHELPSSSNRRSPAAATQTRSQGVQTLIDLYGELEKEPLPSRAGRRRKINAIAAKPPPPPTPLELEISQGEVIYSGGFRRVVRLQSGRVVKCGGFHRPGEISAMNFVAQNTTIPIPGSIELIRESRKTYLLMDNVDGRPLKEVWGAMSDEEKATILAELKGYVDQLRAFEGSYIGSLDNEPCWDGRLVNNPCGPFDTERQFNDHIVANLKDAVPQEYRAFLRRMLKDGHKVVFTHGDLHPGNILVKDGRIVAILDWEMSGWYPEYWEYCKIMWNEDFDSDWGNRVHEFLTPYDYEYALDRVLLGNSPGWW
ncbi:hypothetical protein BOTBODRAFT_35848 [Botryobasidium botryosum FD-172 SS1]|uniref:Aminoglycoside phosphotransferase domain-containing protein n=1 Tax=Botryobasidium botryosum (strain FD-172 SS1) TaxID=930990 RepID=A0A067MH85_BOTB1|nr:hypothetical protein BOTBODRAFT_35848 [Botryobasidium botryosum FD-172 SS1]